LAFTTALMVMFALVVPLIQSATAQHGTANPNDIDVTSDSAQVGVCNPITVSATTVPAGGGAGLAAEGETIDINVTQGDGDIVPNITIGFCDPDMNNAGGDGPGSNLAGGQPANGLGPTASGPNPFCDVDDDLPTRNGGTFGRPDPQNAQTTTNAQGQTSVFGCSDLETSTQGAASPAQVADECLTEGGTGDRQGRCTFGVISDTPGQMQIVACFEQTTQDNDCSDEAVQGSGTKTWLATGTNEQAETISCAPATDSNPTSETRREQLGAGAGPSEHTFQCTVRDASGAALSGVTVSFDVTAGPNAEEIGINTCGPTDTQGRTAATAEPAPATGFTSPAGTGGTECDYEDVEGPGSPPGTDTITAFVQQGSVDNPTGQLDPGEPSTTISKTWTTAPRTIDCEPEAAENAPGTTHIVTCTTRDAQGQPTSDAVVRFTEQGPGRFTTEGCGAQANFCDILTDQTGQADVAIATGQNETGTTTIIGEILIEYIDPATGAVGRGPTECARTTGGGTPGVCSDSVQKTWTTSPTNTTPPTPPNEVDHARSISIDISHVFIRNRKGNRVRWLKVSGNVGTTGEFEGCAGGVPVKVQIRTEGGGWLTRKSDTTSARGRYKVLIADSPGRYRAVAPKIEVPDEQTNTVNNCLRAAAKQRHRHNRR